VINGIYQLNIYKINTTKTRTYTHTHTHMQYIHVTFHATCYALLCSVYLFYNKFFAL